LDSTDRAADAIPSWDREVDLLVFGAGAAGMTTAVVARSEGLDVLLCEKLDQVGGTTATSGGMVFAPGNPVTARAGRADSMEDAGRYLHGELGLPPGDPMLGAFVETAPAAVRYLEERTQVRFDAPSPNPDYHDREGASRGGRTMVPTPFDGRRLGADFDLVRAPLATLTVLGGMMVARREVALLVRPFASLSAAKFTLRTLWRHARDRMRYRRGTRLLLGNALAARLLASVRDAGVVLQTGTPLVRLVLAEGRVLGAVVRHGGVELAIRARRGVVLATGGFAGGAEWRARLAGAFPVAHSLAFADSNGEGMAAAEAAGAAIDGSHESPIFWMPVSIDNRRPDAPQLWMHGVLDRAKPGLIAVDRHGRRFTNEANSYHDFVMGMFSAGVREAFLICDARFLRTYGLGMVPPVIGGSRSFLRSGYLRRGATLAELAARTGIDPEGLERTVREFNAHACAGQDPAFGRGSTALNVHNGDPRQRPNPCVAPLGEGPFHAVAVYPGILGTSAGVRTDVDARACRTDASVIEGLYACGNDMASAMRGAYPGPGITLGPGIVFAYRAAMHAAHPPSSAPVPSPAPLRQPEKALHET
jgi:3-oxosteroid 1-dehydrogenase